jgi:hypothetical protein
MYGNKEPYIIEAKRKWDHARRQAMWSRLFANVRGNSATLLDFNELSHRLRLRTAVYRGLQTILVEQIIGSVGRYQDFTGAFLPTNGSMSERWRKIARITLDPEDHLPPVDVFKVGDWYFVKDGNHRVSVARQVGATYIDAEVWDYPDIHVEHGANIETLLIEAERQDFLNQTQLDAVKPDHNIRLSATFGYPELACQIVHYREVLQQIDGVETSFSDAVSAWYEMIYETSIQLIEESGVMELFPDRTPADFFVWVMRHHHEIETRYGKRIFLGEAARDLRRQGPFAFLKRVLSRLSRKAP